MFGPVERFVNSFNKHDVSPNLSALAQYCEDSESFLDLTSVILDEICAGSQAIGIFGSRERGTNDPLSDLDVASLHNWFWLKNPAFYKGKPRQVMSTRSRDLKYPDGEVGPWIHITRFPTDYHSLGEEGLTMLQQVKWNWFKDTKTRDELYDFLTLLRKAEYEAALWNKAPTHRQLINSVFKTSSIKSA